MAKLAFAPRLPAGKTVSRILVLLAGLLASAALLAAAAPWVFSPAALRAEILAQIRDMTGLEAIAQGDAVLVVLPRPHVSIDSIGFEDPSGALRVETRHLEGYLHLGALLTGRLEIARVLMNQPKLVIDIDGRPMPPDSAIGRAADAKSATPQASSADEARLGTLEIVDGSARLSNASGASTLSIEAINVTIHWPKLGAAAHVAGRIGWHGETAAIDALIGRPLELIRGVPSPINVRIAASVASVSFDGTLASMPKAQLNGRVLASLPSGQRLTELAGMSHALPAPFDDVALRCDATIDESGAILTGLDLRFDGNAFAGALALRAGEGPPVLSGSLTTGALSLRPFLAGSPAALGRDRQWSRVPFDLSSGLLPDLDLRVAATRVDLGRFALADVAFSLLGRGPRLELALTEAKALQGSLAGRVSFGAADGVAGVRANASFAAIDLAAFPSDPSGAWPIGGTMTGTAQIESTGATMNELMRNLDGHAEVDLEEGEFRGMDLERALRRLEKRPLALASQIDRGKTAFDSASFRLRIALGVAEIEQGLLRTPLVDLSLGGTADLAERSWNLYGLATPIAKEQKSLRETPRLHFDVAGSFDDPVFLPDVRSLIRHSGAAAPLFRQAPDASNRQSQARDGKP